MVAELDAVVVVVRVVVGDVVRVLEPVLVKVVVDVAVVEPVLVGDVVRETV